MWRFFAKIMIGLDFVDEFFASPDFLNADKAERAARVYKARDGHADRSPINLDLVNPTWQLEYIDMLLDPSITYRVKRTLSDSKIILFSGTSDKQFVLRQFVNIDSRVFELEFYDTSHRGLLAYPHIKHIMSRVIDTIRTDVALLTNVAG